MINSLAGIAFAVVMGAASYVDIRKHEIYFWAAAIIGSLAIIRLITGCLSVWSVLGGIFIAGLPLLFLYKKNIVGDGDIILGTVCGAFAGITVSVYALILSYAGPFLFSAAERLFRKRSGALPFVPFLSAGYIVIYFLSLGGLVF